MTDRGILTIRNATESDELIISRHLHLIAVELGVSRELIFEDWLDRTIEFIQYARREFQYAGFIAEVDGEIIGSASCQVTKMYPTISSNYIKGYIWGVYVVPSYRRQGIAKALMSRTHAHLRKLNCTEVIVHASDMGKNLYASLGYTQSNEMILKIA